MTYDVLQQLGPLPPACRRQAPLRIATVQAADGRRFAFACDGDGGNVRQIMSLGPKGRRRLSQCNAAKRAGDISRAMRDWIAAGGTYDRQGHICCRLCGYAIDRCVCATKRPIAITIEAHP